LLSYLPRNLSNIRRQIESPKNPVTVLCPDAKSFYNVALTVYGKDIPGLYNIDMQTAMFRELSLIHKTFEYQAKQTITDVVRWRNPALSLYLFYGWMHFVATESMRFVSLFILSSIFFFMLRNYLKYHANSAASKLFGCRTIGDMTRILLVNQHDSKGPTQHRRQSNSHPILEQLLRIFGLPPMDANSQDSWKFEDHAEFPLSAGCDYNKLSSDEAAARPTWEAAQASFDFSDEDQIMSDDGSNNEYTPDDISDSGDESCDTNINKPSAKASVPDQNIDNIVKKKSLSTQLKERHSRLQQVNFHLFDDRVFIAEDRADAKKQLKMSSKNPISNRINPILSLFLKIIECEISAFRAVFNILFWKDPILSYWTMVLVCCLMIVVSIFPWRQFFFILGLLSLGPQNYFIFRWYRLPLAAKKHRNRLLSNSTRSTKFYSENNHTNREGGNDKPLESSPGNEARSSNSPLLIRNNVQIKPDGKLRKVIVPSVPFRYNRFYDWPPDPDSTAISTPHNRAGSPKKFNSASDHAKQK